MAEIIGRKRVKKRKDDADHDGILFFDNNNDNATITTATGTTATTTTTWRSMNSK